MPDVRRCHSALREVDHRDVVRVRLALRVPRIVGRIARHRHAVRHEVRGLRGTGEAGGVCGIQFALHVLVEGYVEVIIRRVRREVGDAVRRGQIRIGVDHRSAAVPVEGVTRAVAVAVPQHEQRAHLGALRGGLGVVGVDRAGWPDDHGRGGGHRGGGGTGGNEEEVA